MVKLKSLSSYSVRESVGKLPVSYVADGNVELSDPVEKTLAIWSNICILFSGNPSQRYTSNKHKIINAQTPSLRHYL